MILDGSTTNVFVIREGVIHTHPSDGSILAGVTRDYVIQLARRLSLTVEESETSEAEIPLFDEMFITGTTAEVLPVVELNDHPIGDGTPGRLTRKLQDMFRNAVDKWIADCRAARG
jgi:D-alanine transaminase